MIKYMQSVVYHIDSSEKFKVLVQQCGNSLLVLDFSASWCGPCKRIAPYFEQLARKYTSVVFAKIDVDEVPDVASGFHVSAMPTFIFVKNGNEITRFEGANQKQLEENIINFG